MSRENILNYLKELIKNCPSDWLNLTTHRLDIYHEDQAKTEFIEEFEKFVQQQITDTTQLAQLPTAYDYIRLGHPLSSVLEWAMAQFNDLPHQQVISFSSRTAPILAVLRKNAIDKRNTLIAYTHELPSNFELEKVKAIYNYSFESVQVKTVNDIPNFDGSVIFYSSKSSLKDLNLPTSVDFYIQDFDKLGSIISIHGEQNKEYVSAIQHLRRRETIAMTPADCLTLLQEMTDTPVTAVQTEAAQNQAKVLQHIKQITASSTDAHIGSSGLSVQYAIMMGLIDYANENHPQKDIKIIVPPNCYGGTNDQARRVAAVVDGVSILDLPVDGDNDMVQSIEKVLQQVAEEDAVPLIIAEIPTNPRVEVPNLEKLKTALAKARTTPSGENAIPPVFILDQTFCPNVQFLSETGILADVQTISYVSGSKFPSGGKCTAGYCVANQKAAHLMEKIGLHMALCDNKATDLQMAILAEQIPSMLERIQLAYENTRSFVNFIKEELPTAKINFVSEDLAQAGFTPSVFSLDLPTKGNTHEERENYKRALNLKLINKMIGEIPTESKYCVSYGQLKGCYWTIPATSTQGTTKESDKDYIARVSVSPQLDLDKHKAVFADFVAQMDADL